MCQVNWLLKHLYMLFKVWKPWIIASYKICILSFQFYDYFYLESTFPNIQTTLSCETCLLDKFIIFKWGPWLGVLSSGTWHCAVWYMFTDIAGLQIQASRKLREFFTFFLSLSLENIVLLLMKPNDDLCPFLTYFCIVSYVPC